MTVLLYFLAFPGLFLIAAASAFVASRRYIAFLELHDAYREPTLDDVVDHGIVGMIRRDRVAELRAQAEVDAGRFGAEAQKLRATVQSRQRIVVVSLPLGVVLLVMLTYALPTGALSIGPVDTSALLILYLGALAAIGLICLISAWKSISDGRPSLAARYLLGLVSLGIGAIIGVIALLSPP